MIWSIGLFLEPVAPLRACYSDAFKTKHKQTSPVAQSSVSHHQNLFMKPLFLLQPVQIVCFLRAWFWFSFPPACWRRQPAGFQQFGVFSPCACRSKAGIWNEGVFRCIQNVLKCASSAPHQLSFPWYWQRCLHNLVSTASERTLTRWL